MKSSKQSSVFDFISSKPNAFYSDNIQEKKFFEINRFHLNNNNKEISLSPLKIPDSNEKLNLEKKINETKYLIDKCDLFFKNMQIEGKSSKKKIVKEQVTLDNFYNKNRNFKGKNNMNRINLILKDSNKHYLNPNLAEKKEIEDYIYNPSLTEEPNKNEEDVYKLYYIKRINMENYKKLFNIGDGAAACTENINYLETLPEKNIGFNKHMLTNNFSDFTQTKDLIINDGSGKFFNRNLAYCYDDSALMAKLMLKMEIKINKLKKKDKRNKRTPNKQKNQINDRDITSNFYSEISNISRNTQNAKNNTLMTDINQINRQTSYFNEQENNFLNRLDSNKLNYLVEKNDNEMESNKSNNRFYEKYSPNKIKENNKIDLMPKIENRSNLYDNCDLNFKTNNNKNFNQLKINSYKNSKLILLSKNNIIDEKKETPNIENFYLNTRKKKIIDINFNGQKDYSSKILNTDDKDNSNIRKNYLNFTKDNIGDYISTRKYDSNNLNIKNNINQLKEKEILNNYHSLKYSNITKLSSNNNLNDSIFKKFNNEYVLKKLLDKNEKNNNVSRFLRK